MEKLVFIGKVDSIGKLTLNNKYEFQKYLQRFIPVRKEFTFVELYINKKKSKRSHQQNAFFHSWVKLLSEHTGYEFEEMKAILKSQFLTSEKVNEKTGSIYKYVKETHKLNKSEFADFCSEVQRWCNIEFNIVLPLPNENWTIKFD